MPRWPTWALLAAGTVVVGLTAGALRLASSAWPTDGTRAAAGLAASVELYRDRWGVPHVFAQNEEDAAAALGWAHASDRLWQMEAMRRLGAGRLAEIVGPAALPSDRWMRTVGVYALAQRQYPRLSDRSRRLLDAYARGVDAWIAGGDQPLPPEFLVLGLQPEPWTPADSLVWLKLMAMRLSGDRREELLRARLTGRLTPEQMADLWPDDSDGPVTLPARSGHAEAEALAPERLARLMAAMAEPPGEAHGASNVWVLAGHRTATGKPLLANDPHLAFTLPLPWYLARLSTPDGEVAGATSPGFPALILGHNDRVAWGLTTSDIDVEDVFVERIDPSDPGRYLAPGGTLPFDRREETIAVKGQAPEVLVVRRSRHGPVISDVAGGGAADGTVLALAATWLAEHDSTADGLFELGRARDARDVLAAAAKATAPQQNLFYADVDGRIGWIAAGQIPLRPPGGGRLPAEGWTGAADWRGFVPVAGWPQATEPRSGVLINANNRPVPPDWPWPINGSWDVGFRAQRIAERLAPATPQTFEEQSALQLDAVSLMARRLLPLMLAALPPPTDPAAATAAALLVGWTGEMRADRPEPLIFAAWLRAFVRAVAADELGDAFAAWWDYRPLFVERVLTGHGRWCDDIGTAADETCGAQLGCSLGEATADLTRRLGATPADWRWGELHAARFEHPFWGRVPLVGRLVDARVPMNGGNDTIDRAASQVANDEEPFGAVHGAGFRGVYDLADLGRSQFVLATGQSGNPLSRHFRDLTAMWRAGSGIRLDATRESLQRDAETLLVLEPDSAPPAQRAGAAGSGTGIPSSAR